MLGHDASIRREETSAMVSLHKCIVNAGTLLTRDDRNEDIGEP